MPNYRTKPRQITERIDAKLPNFKNFILTFNRFTRIAGLSLLFSMIIGCTRDNSSKLGSPLVCTIIVGRCQRNAVTELVEVPALRRRLYKSITTQPQHARRVCIRAQRVKHLNKLYSFEVIKIELLDFIESNSSISTANDPNSQGGLIINIANILQNVEKSYDKGKFLLEESKKATAGTQFSECSKF